ncbi:hypothetical protein [Streptomyces sp. NPDC026589]|uniref:hypothetical protein n=1 Tax=Streptomyces sp. NPDC026589 TaxID=3155609 RepID=UPI0033F61462
MHVTALPDLHHTLFAAAATPGANGASLAEREAYRIYADRLNNAVVSAVPWQRTPSQ